MFGDGYRASELENYSTDIQNFDDTLLASARAIRQASGAPPSPLKTNFADSELILIGSWAEFHDVRVSIEVDNFWDGEAPDEVIALYPTASPHRCWTLWRHTDAVEIQHLFGERRVLRSVPEALDSMIAPLPEPPSENIRVVQDTPRF